ncbi:MAG: hypothetical protein ABSD98_05075 [Candidatus Korobacteraceae bacterium]
MSNDAERQGIGRLWSEGAARDKATRPEAQPSTDNVVQLRPDRAYVAHEVREHPQRLHICCATQPSHYPAYSSLLNMIHDHNFDKAFTLVYSFMLVEVTGNHLGAIVHAINYGNCERITEYHAKLYDRPAPDQPIIEAIKVTAAVTFLKETETT